MKKKPDWATKAAKAMQPNIRLFANDGTPADSVFIQWMSSKLRAASRRGKKEEQLLSHSLLKRNTELRKVLREYEDILKSAGLWGK